MDNEVLKNRFVKDSNDSADTLAGFARAELSYARRLSSVGAYKTHAPLSIPPGA